MRRAVPYSERWSSGGGYGDGDFAYTLYGGSWGGDGGFGLKDVISVTANDYEDLDEGEDDE